TGIEGVPVCRVAPRGSAHTSRKHGMEKARPVDEALVTEPFHEVARCGPWDGRSAPVAGRRPRLTLVPPAATVGGDHALHRLWLPVPRPDQLPNTAGLPHLREADGVEPALRHLPPPLLLGRLGGPRMPGGRARAPARGRPPAVASWDRGQGPPHPDEDRKRPGHERRGPRPGLRHS